MRVLMGSAEELVGSIFRKTIEEGGHLLTILNPYEKEQEFLAEARAGGYDVVIIINLGSRRITRWASSLPCGGFVVRM